MQRRFENHLKVLKEAEKDYENRTIPYIKHCRELQDAIFIVKRYTLFSEFRWNTVETFKMDIKFFEEMEIYSVAPELGEIAGEIREDIELVEDFMLGYFKVKK